MWPFIAKPAWSRPNRPARFSVCPDGAVPAGGDDRGMVDNDTQSGVTAPAPPFPIQPNMLVANGSGVSSTFAKLDLSHSVLTQVRLFNTRLHRVSLDGAAFDDADLDGAVFTGCSLRCVRLVDCDVDRMVINGIQVGSLLRLLHGSMEVS